MKQRVTPYRDLLRELGDGVVAHGLPVVRDFAAALLEVLQRHGEVRIPGMGTFRVRRRKARRIRAPGKAPAAERGMLELREGTEVRFRACGAWRAALTELQDEAEVDSERLRRRRQHEATDALLHPGGRCTCGGEGKCEWCVLEEINNHDPDWSEVNDG